MNERFCKVHAYQQTDISRANARVYNRHTRDKEANAFYQSTQWTNTRHRIMVRALGIDEITGKPTENGIVDHIIPLRVDWSKRLDESNLMYIDKSTHNIKTMVEEQVLNSHNGENKIKHLKKSWWKKIIKNYLAKNKK